MKKVIIRLVRGIGISCLITQWQDVWHWSKMQSLGCDVDSVLWTRDS